MKTVRVLLLLFLVPLAGLAQDAKEKLAPDKDLPGPFHPYNVNGASKDRYHCLVSEYGDDPTVLLFARGLEDVAGFKDLLTKMNGIIERNPTTRLRCFVVFLADDIPKPAEDDDKRDALVAKLRADLAEALKLKGVIICLGSKADAEKYGLDDAAALTVVVYRKLSILSSQVVSKDKVNDELASSLLKEVATRFGAKR